MKNKILALLLILATLISGFTFNFATVQAKEASYTGISVNEPLGHYVLKDNVSGETFLAYCADRNADYPQGENFTELNNADIIDQNVKDIIWNGYPYNKAGFKERYKLTDGELRSVTQNALWYYWQKKGGNYHSMGSNFPSKVIDAYFDFIYEKNLNLIGLAPNAQQLKTLDFKHAPKYLTLKVYNTDEKQGVQRMVVPNYDERPSVRIAKVNAAGQKLDGATLTFKTQGQDIDTWTSGQTPKEFPLDIDKDHPEKEYSVEESVAPNGYEQLKQPVKFKVTRKPTGNHVIQVWNENFSEYGAEEDLNENYVLKIKNIKARKNFSFIKKSTDGEVLSGVEFKFVNHDDGSIEQTVVSGATASTVSLQLDTNYTISETKVLAGYSPFEPITITVTKDGEIILPADRQRDIKKINDTYEIYNAGAKFAINIKKLTERGYPLPGPKFDVLIGSTDMDVAKIYDNNGVEKTLLQMKPARVNFEGFDTPKAVKYYLEDFAVTESAIQIMFNRAVITSGQATDMEFFVIEKEPLPGYKVQNLGGDKKVAMYLVVGKKLNSSELKIKYFQRLLMGKTGQDEYTVYKADQYSDDQIQLLAETIIGSNKDFNFAFVNKKPNENKHYITFIKEDANGRTLKDVHFEIPMKDLSENHKDDENKTTVPIKWKTEADGSKTIALAPDTYILKETAKANSSYANMEDIKFKVIEEGNRARVEIVEDPSAAARVVNNNTVKIRNVIRYDGNKKAPVNIIKRDERDGNVLEPTVKFNFVDSQGSNTEAQLELGIAHIELAPGKYRVSEEIAGEALSKYEKVKDFYIEVNKDGTVGIDSHDGEDDISVDKGNNIKVVDRYKLKDVVIDKVGTNGEKVKGAKIEIKNNAGKVVDAFVSGEDSHAFKLSPGTYVFHEVSAPTGYEAVNDFTFSVTEAQGIQVAAEAAGVASYQEGKLTVIDKKETKKVRFSKQNFAGEEIAGAEIKIKQGDAEVIAWTSVADETKTIELEPGTYTFHEERVEGEYDTVSDFKFSVDESNNVTLTNVDTSNVVKVGDKITVIDDYKNAKEISFSKRDMGGEEIGGAEIQVKQGNSVKAKWISEAGKTKQLKLPAGDYSFSEKAPAGYKNVTTVFTFSIDQSGQVAITGNNGDKLSLEGNKLILKNEIDVVENPQTGSTKPIKIAKVDVAGEEVVGALIEIRKGTAVNGLGDTVFRWKSEQGKVQTVNLEQGTYTLHEEAAPKGMLAVSDVEFTVNADGSVEVNHPKAKYEGEVLKITDEAKNKKVYKDELEEAQKEVTFSKQAINGSAELVGATLKILKGEVAQDQYEQATAVHTWQSTNQATKFKLAAGTYTMVETTAPDGYEKAEGIVFKITSDLKVQIKGKDGSFSEQADATVTMRDAEKAVEKISVQVNKTWVGGRKSPITVALFRDNVDTNLRKNLNEQNGWQEQFSDLPKADGPFLNSHVYSYTVAEVGAEAGKITIDGREYNVKITEPQNNSFAITNTYISKNAKVTINKFTKNGDGSEKRLAGAGLKLVQTKDEQGQPITGRPAYIKTFFSAEDSDVELDLVEGEYVLTEEKAPEGYKKAEPLTFRVNHLGKLELVTVNAENVETVTPIDGMTVKLENLLKWKDVVIEPQIATKNVKVVKTWSGITSVPDEIEVELYRQVAGSAVEPELVQTSTLNKANKFTEVFTKLPIYTQDKQKYIYSVKEKGQQDLSVTVGDNTYAVDIQPIEEDDGNNGKLILGYTINNTYKAKEMTVKFDKVKADDMSAKLAGAELKITKVKDESGRPCAENKVEWSWTSDGNTTKDLLLTEGEYILNEVVAPADYVKIKPIKFRVNSTAGLEIAEINQATNIEQFKAEATGVLTIVNGKNDPTKPNDDSNETNKDRIKIKVVKKWRGGYNENAQIKVDLYQKIGDAEAKVLASKILTVNNNWQDVFVNLPTVVKTVKNVNDKQVVDYEPVSYYVEEHGVVGGKIIIADKEYASTVESLSENNNGEVKAQGYVIVNKYLPKVSEGISFDKITTDKGIKNAEGEEARFYGAKLRIVKIKDENNEATYESKPEWQWTSDGKNPLILKLPVGEYLFEEIEAPAGYNPAKPIKFRINYRAVLELSSIVNKKEIFTPVADNRIKMENSKNPAKLHLDDPSNFDFRVTKKWQGKILADQQITVELWRAIDGQSEKVGQKTIVLNKDNKWTNVFEDLPAEVKSEENGIITFKRINYFVKEAGQTDDNKVDIQGNHYGVGIDTDEENSQNQTVKHGVIITNTFIPEAADITFSKKAVNGTEELPGANLKIVRGEDAAGKEIIDEWLSGKVAHEVELTEGRYTMIEEQAPLGYAVAEKIVFAVTHDGKLLIKNAGGEFVGDDALPSTVVMRDALIPKEILSSTYNMKVNKEWVNSKDLDKDIVVQLFAGTEDLQKEIILNKANNFTNTFENLPVSDKNLQEIDYRVKEKGMTDDNLITIGMGSSANKYAVEIKKVTDKAGYKDFVITNTYLPTQKEISFSKTAVNETKELPGAELKIVKGENRDGTEILAKWISGNKMHKVVLPEGVYTMVEIQAPLRYDLAESITFEVTHEDELLIKDADGKFVKQDEAIVRMQDQPSKSPFIPGIGGANPPSPGNPATSSDGNPGQGKTKGESGIVKTGEQDSRTDYALAMLLSLGVMMLTLYGRKRRGSAE